MQFHRAIPQDDYITLGTIRYGIKFGAMSNTTNPTKIGTLSIGEANDVLANGYHLSNMINKTDRPPEIEQNAAVPNENDNPVCVIKPVMPKLTQLLRKSKMQGKL